MGGVSEWYVYAGQRFIILQLKILPIWDVLLFILEKA